MPFKIAGTVILYNPLAGYENNILTYSNQVDCLFIVNNSDSPLPKEFDRFKNDEKIIFLGKNNNIGIGAALNIALREASARGFDLLLTMDQDSSAEPGMISELSEYFNDDRVAIVSPHHHSPVSGKKPAVFPGCREVLTVMTSGNLVRIKTITEIGGYAENFFIDYVDNEICLRLIAKGYKVLQCNHLFLRHNLGTEKVKTLLNRKFYPTNYSPERYYYQARNRLYVYHSFKKLFPAFIKEDRRNFAKRIIKMLLFEDNKAKKIKNIIRGYMDYFKSIQGKFTG